MSEIALSRVAPLFGGNLIPRSGVIELVTDPRPWAHSAEAEFDIPQIQTRPEKLEVTLRVESGRVGVGWLRGDGKGWIDHAIARSDAKTRPVLEIPAGTEGGKLVFTNQREDGKPSRVVIERIGILDEPIEDEFQAALAAEERGDNEAAVFDYRAVVANNPAHVSAIAGLGRLRYVDPPQPVLDGCAGGGRTTQFSR